MSEDRPPPRSLSHVLEEVLLDEEIERYQAMSSAEVDERLAKSGFDEALTLERMAAGRAAAYAAPVAEVPLPAAPPSNVVDLAAKRAARVASTRWLPFLAAAGLALVAGGGGAQYAATRMPARTVEYPTRVLPPPPGKVAAPVRRWALRQCALGYFGECEDALDDARAIDPEGENDAAVKEARTAIMLARDGETPGGANGLYAKPRIGPTERPLQRHP
ncbi:MAG TPA: hypothetical protein VGL81_29535 [Polyangiaceae bacterium]